jgi:hypothetical protein
MMSELLMARQSKNCAPCRFQFVNAVKAAMVQSMSPAHRNYAGPDFQKEIKTFPGDETQHPRCQSRELENTIPGALPNPPSQRRQ